MILLPVLAVAVLVWAYRKQKIRRLLFLTLVAAAVFGALAIAAEELGGTREEVQAIERSEKEALLEVRTEDGELHEVTIRVPEEEKSGEEIRQALLAAAEELPQKILGKNASADHVEWDLLLPTAIEGTGAEVFWTTDRPEILGWDGRIGADVPAAGAEVLLLATLTWGEEEVTARQKLTVFPSRETHALQARLQAEGDAQNGEEGETYALPSSLAGQKITWFREKERTGVVFSALVLMVAVLLILSSREKTKKAEAERRRELVRAYPALVGRIQLLYEAGLSTRRVFERLAKDHRRAVRETGKSSPAYEEIARTWHDLENGVDMETALTNFGRRCSAAPYRTLSLLLSRTQKKGGALLLPLLEREVQEAGEARRRRARAEGEKTTTRLLLPMVLMLIVVLVVLLVPAVLSF